MSTTRTTDRVLAERIRAGEAGAAAELVGRDHGIATLLAEAVGITGGIEHLWSEHLAEVRAGALDDGLLVALLTRVHGAAPASTGPSAPPGSTGTIVPDGDRWEGWWDAEPPPWPDGSTVDVLAALHLLPVEQREVLVLGHVAALPAADLNAVLGRPAGDRSVELDLARDAYLRAVDVEVAGRARR